MLSRSGSGLWIIDVGHGNATVLEDGDRTAVIDGGRGDTLVRFLDERGITRIDTVIVSHVDADHFGGVSLLLSDTMFEVGSVFVNPDSRNSDLWRDFLTVMCDAQRRGTKFNLELTCINPGKISLGSALLEVLAPSQQLAYRTPQARRGDGRQVSPNAMSGVIRVSAGESMRVLLAGDIDQVGLDSLLADCSDLAADVLVFPHHGGRPGSDPACMFARTLTREVNPSLVVFSISRGHTQFPRPEIVASVLDSVDGVHVACTQLSQLCAAHVPVERSNLHSGIAKGASENSCCARTISISLERASALSPSLSAHNEFIDKHAPSALCRRR